MPARLISRIRLPAQSARLKDLRREVRAAIQSVCRDPEQIDHLVIAINEASMNVIEHAYQHRSDGIIELEIHHDGDQLRFRVIDFAEPVSAESLKSPHHHGLTPGGLGLHIIREVMDDMQFTSNTHGDGNVMEMRVTLNNSKGHNDAG